MISAELKPYSSGQVRLSGADVALPARHALSLGMVFHELATNAAKHGSLSVPGGRLDIGWAVEVDGDEPVLRFDWRESGKLVGGRPTSRGFGSRLIHTSVEVELSGTVRTAYEPTGLCCTLLVPLGSAVVGETVSAEAGTDEGVSSGPIADRP